MILIGSLSLQQNIRKAQNQTFFAISFFCCIWMMSLYFGFSYTRAESIETANGLFRIAHGAGIAAMSAMTVFIFIYPQKNFKLPSFLQYSYLSISAALILIASFSPLVYESVVIHPDGSLSDIFGVLFSAFIIHTLSSQLFCIIVSLKKVQQSRGIIRRKLQLCFFGFTIFALSAFTTNGILPLFDIYIFQKEAPLFALFFLVPSFYSLYQHRFFNFSYQSLNITRQLLLLCSFLSIYGLSYFSLSILSDSLSQTMIMSTSALIGLSIYLYFSKKYPELVSEAYQKVRRTIINEQQKIYHCPDYHSLEKQIQKTFQVQLNIKNAKLFMLRKSKISSKIPSYSPDILSNSFLVNDDEVLVREELSFEKGKKKIRAKMEKLQAKLCFPLYSEGKLIGLFSLGEKGKGSFYGKEEIKLFLEFKKHLEICFMNILLEAGMQKENNLMQKSIEKHTKKIRDKYNQTKSLLKKQEDCLSLAAHELKNPLHTLMIQIEISLMDLDQSHQNHEDLKGIESSVEKLQHLTTNLFDAQQYDLDKASLSSEAVFISEFINEIYFEFQSSMRHKNLIFTLNNRVSKNTKLSIDPTKIRQVLHNLLHNAIKFTPPSGNISLSLHETSLTFKIQVSDSGCGIKKSERVHIFEKFKHGNEHHGLGIGLYVSKKIIQLHKGSLEVKDRKEGGTVFIVTLRKGELRKKKENPVLTKQKQSFSHKP